MSLPQRIAAYTDCFDIYDKAVTKGARVCFATKSEAQQFGHRMRQARSLRRDEASRMYDKTDRRWGKTDYDRLIVRHPVEDDKGEWWVYVEPYGSNILAVEELDSNYVPDLETPDAASNLD
jgi:hypothetical protein